MEIEWRSKSLHKNPFIKGGYSRMIDYLNRSIRYPKRAQKQNIKGIVKVSFIVNRNAAITKVEIVQSAHPVLDKEALRVVRQMKQWISGRRNSHTVDAKVVIPISFGIPQIKKSIPK